jgi:phasin family protein
MPMNAKANVDQTANVAADAAQQGAATVRSGVNQASANFENAQAQVKEGVNRVMRTAEELVKFSQGNIEAYVRSSQIWAAGVQDLTKQAANSAQASFNETVSTLKQLTTVRSVKEAVDLQANLARNSVEKAVAESGRLADASVKLAEQALAPITARVRLAVEKFAKPV